MSIRERAMWYAFKSHKEVNHLYDGKPYDVHLTLCFDVARRFMHLLPKENRENIFAAVWLHDTIEDCRKAYNDIQKEFGTFVADIVYACTNEKGRTRKERANDVYYYGINETPFANFVKVCDRIANMEYSISTKSRMYDMYVKEMPEFFDKLWCHNLSEMFDYLKYCLTDSEKRIKLKGESGTGL